MPKRPPTHRPVTWSPPSAKELKRPEWRKWYNTTQWRKLRKHQLVKEPLCRFCKKDGRTTVANVADHITAHKGNRELFFDPDNLQSLCHPCHDGTKQRMERGSPLMRWDEDGMPIAPPDYA